MKQICSYLLDAGLVTLMQKSGNAACVGACRAACTDCGRSAGVGGRRASVASQERPLFAGARDAPLAPLRTAPRRAAPRRAPQDAALLTYTRKHV